MSDYPQPWGKWTIKDVVIGAAFLLAFVLVVHHFGH